MINHSFPEIFVNHTVFAAALRLSLLQEGNRTKDFRLKYCIIWHKHMIFPVWGKTENKGCFFFRWSWWKFTPFPNAAFTKHTNHLFGLKPECIKVATVSWSNATPEVSRNKLSTLTEFLQFVALKAEPVFLMIFQVWTFFLVYCLESC